MRKILYTVLLVICYVIYVNGQEDVDSIAFMDSIPVEIIYNRSLQDGNIKLGRNHFFTFPGSFDDPSRLLMKYPGIGTQNDQANFIIYDGMPPHYVKWTLYDTDIVNPNHLSNAGTISDRNSRASGGVNSFSGQIIGSFDFNSQAGMDGDLLAHAGSANLRPRTPFENKLFFNIGVIGLEAGIERKLNASGTANLIANYRYSFTGLLGNMGVDFGGETIGFQDLFAKINFQDKRGNAYSLFTLYGSSYNDHAAQEEVEIIKDGLDIRYDGNVFVAGVHQQGASGKFENNLIFSSRQDYRVSSKPSGFLPSLDVGNSNSELFESRISLHSKLNINSKFRLGLKASNYTFDPNAAFGDGLSMTKRLSYLEVNPYLKYLLIDGKSVKLTTMLSTHYETAFDEFSFMPAAELSYDMGKESSVKLKYSLTAQMQAPELYQLESDNGIVSPNLNKSKAHHLRLSYNKSDLTLSGFYHKLFSLANPSLGPSGGIRAFFTDLSNLDVLEDQRLNNEGKGDIYGISAHYEKSIANNLFIGANLTGFKSTAVISILGDLRYKSPYDFGSIFNARLSKQFDFSSRKFLKVSVAFHYRGGAREQPIDLEKSSLIGRTVYDQEILSFEKELFDTKLADYHRMDFRISYVKKKSSNSSFKSVISMDIQNVMNRENDAYHFYDPITNKVQLQKQLGMLPVISYRIEF